MIPTKMYHPVLVHFRFQVQHKDSHLQAHHQEIKGDSGLPLLLQCWKLRSSVGERKQTGSETVQLSTLRSGICSFLKGFWSSVCGIICFTGIMNLWWPVLFLFFFFSPPLCWDKKPGGLMTPEMLKHIQKAV